MYYLAISKQYRLFSARVGFFFFGVSFCVGPEEDKKNGIRRSAFS